MKIRTNLKAGNMIDQAQSQAERVFDSTNQTLNQAAGQIRQFATVTGQRLGKAWNCFLSS